MLIRSKYHRLGLGIAASYAACALFVVVFKSDHFMVPFYFFFAAFLTIVWLSTYTTLSNGVLTRRILFFAYQRIPVGEITRIAPHKKNGKWSYGTVVDVFSNNGAKMTVQPARPQPFLTALREQAAQAAYLL